MEAVEDKLASEQAQWSRERSALVLERSAAEKELAQLKNDLRKTEIELEREREKYFTPSSDIPASPDREKVGRGRLV